MIQIKSSKEIEIFLILDREPDLEEKLNALFADDPFLIINNEQTFNQLREILPYPTLLCFVDASHISKEKLEMLEAIAGTSPIASFIYSRENCQGGIIRKVHISRIFKYFLKPVDYEALLIAIRTVLKYHRDYIYKRILSTKLLSHYLRQTRTESVEESYLPAHMTAEYRFIDRTKIHGCVR